MVKIPSDSDGRRAASKRFVPKTVSESIRISPENEDRIALIETEESPALESDLNYILATGRQGRVSRFLSSAARIFSFRREVTTAYFLTYHERDEDEYPAAKRGRARKDLLRFIGDEILHVIRFGRVASDNPFLLFVTDFEVGGTRYNRDFLQHEGYIPLERFTGKSSPKWILVGAGTAASVQSAANGDGIEERYLVIPGKINIRFRDRIGLYQYSYTLVSSPQFLQSHPAIRRTARRSNVETVLLISEKMLVLERKDSSWKSIAGIFAKAIRRHRDIRLALAGTFFFNLGSGIQQGAIINPILGMMDALGILILITWLMQYIYPNIVSTISVVLSADRFDRIKSAEKDDLTAPALINLELKKIMRTMGHYSVISVLLLMAVYPGFFAWNSLPAFTVKLAVALVYIGSNFFRDWGVTFEQDALFRIFKRSLSDDEELYPSILRINAVAYSGAILFNLIGIAIGYLAMSLNTYFGIALAVFGVLLALSKFLYPWRGNDYGMALSMNVSPFYSNENEIVIIPDKVLIRSRNPIRIHQKGREKIIYDNYDFEIVLLDPDFLPSIKKVRRRWPASVFRSWTLSWKTGRGKVKLRLTLKDRSAPVVLCERSEGGTVSFSPAGE